MLNDLWTSFAAADEAFEMRELFHLGFREEFQEFFKLRYGDVSADSTVSVGQAGFLFVNDGSNRWRDQLSDNLKIADPDRLASVEKLTALESHCKKNGSQLRFLVIPEKDVVYSDLSPNVANKRLANRTIHSLMPDVGRFTVYPSKELTELRASVHTFHARNSHYNIYGGLLVAQALCASLSRPLSVDKIATDFVTWPDDLSLKWVNGLNTRRRMLRKTYAEEEPVKVEGHVGRHLILKNPAASSKDTIVIFGDSYSWNPDAGVARFMTLDFAEVHFLWKKTVDYDLLDQVKPAVVVLQSAERFLVKGLLQ